MNQHGDQPANADVSTEWDPVHGDASLRSTLAQHPAVGPEFSRHSMRRPHGPARHASLLGHAGPGPQPRVRRSPAPCHDCVTRRRGQPSPYGFPVYVPLFSPPGCSSAGYGCVPNPDTQREPRSAENRALALRQKAPEPSPPPPPSIAVPHPDAHVRRSRYSTSSTLSLRTGSPSHEGYRRSSKPSRNQRASKSPSGTPRNFVPWRGQPGVPWPGRLGPGQ